MLAEIIAIGTEISTGASLDTNSQWLATQLSELGIPTLFHTTVADELDPITSVLRIACGRADLVVITGGLGPTLDDLTRNAMADLAEVPLVLDPDSLSQLEEFFRSRGREMPERNRIQAMFPQGSFPLKNPIGTAPGIWMERERQYHLTCYLAALPGVPSEMKKMFLEQVSPHLEDLVEEQGRVILRRTRINCFGLGESQTEEMLGNLTARGGDPDIGITAHEATITLRVTSLGRTEEQCEAKITKASQEIRNILGDFVFGFEDEELEHIIVRELNFRKLSIATIECATSGLLAEHLAQVKNAEKCFRGGTVLATMSTPPEKLARELRSQTAADIVLFVGAEHLSQEESTRPVSSIPLGLITASGETKQINLKWNGNPAITKGRAMKTVLNMLRLEFLNGEKHA